MERTQGKKGDIVGEFTDEEMVQYVHKHYMHDVIMPMTLSIETSYKHVCLSKMLFEGQKDV